MEQIKVSSSSNPNNVAGAIACMMKTNDQIQIQVIGAAALNQAIKAIAIARGFVTPSGQDLYCIPSFHDLVINQKEVTAIRILVNIK